MKAATPPPWCKSARSFLRTLYDVFAYFLLVSRTISIYLHQRRKLDQKGAKNQGADIERPKASRGDRNGEGVKLLCMHETINHIKSPRRLTELVSSSAVV